jgi:DNA polymerase alpha subunit A
MQTVQKSVQEPHEPLVISCSLHPSISPDASEREEELRVGISTWTAVRRMDSAPLPRGSEALLKSKQVLHYNNESAMLAALLAKIQEFDPDVIAGHNTYGFDLDVIGSRMSALRLAQWQRLGRLRRQKDRMPRVEGKGGGFWVGTNLTNGRLVCDLMLQAKDLLPKLGSYDLPSLAQAQLGLQHLPVVEPEALLRHYESAQGLMQLAETTFHSALCIARLVHSLQLLPLSKQLTNLAGNLWNASLQNKRAERNEMLLCHEFHKKKFVLPDKENMLSKKRRLQIEGGAAGGNAGFDDADEPDQATGGNAPRRGKAEYTGGLVLDPKVGLYDDFVMLLDFNSLYPSIIQEHNICFTTVERPNEVDVSKCQSEVELLGRTRAPDGTEEEGVLPKVLRTLVESRRNVKSAIKSERDPRRLQILEIRQKALKLTANSMYGCLGFRNSRFYAKPLAALITAKGREALQTTITVVQQELTLDVVYGDTDSVFVNTKTRDYDQAIQAAEQIKRSVNKKYKKLEIEIDAVFATVMLLKKKKYAAVKVVDWKNKQFESEYKGLDIVRRDWCKLAKEMGHKVLDKVLAREGLEESVQWVHDYVTEQTKLMDEKQIPLEKYAITKGLTKDPKDYPDAKNQPHVQVALRLQARGHPVRPGQEVEYIICEPTGAEAERAPMASRARHPHEFTLDPTLRVDVDWYKKQQVHPVLSRTLEPIEGTDAARLAECLGLDGARFARAAAARADAEGGSSAPDLSYMEAASADVNALFDRRTRLKSFETGSLPDGRPAMPGVECAKCQHVTSWAKLLTPEAWESNGIAAAYRCESCNAEVNPARAQNLFTLQVKQLLTEHSKGWVRCSEDACIDKTRRIGKGQNMMSEKAVLRELEYVEYLCDTQAAYPGQDNRGVRDATHGIKRVAGYNKSCSGYNWVDCGAIFAGIFNTPKA